MWLPSSEYPARLESEVVGDRVEVFNVCLEIQLTDLSAYELGDGFNIAWCYASSCAPQQNGLRQAVSYEQSYDSNTLHQISCNSSYFAPETCFGEPEFFFRGRIFMDLTINSWIRYSEFQHGLKTMGGEIAFPKPIASSVTS